MSGKSAAGGHDRLISRLADRQHGVLSRKQLLDAGVPGHVIDHRVLLGRLHPRHHGVYVAGHRNLTKHGRWMAAVLAAGAGAVLSHRSAGALLGLGHWSHLEVTAPRRRERPGIRVYTSLLSPDELTTVMAIPTTGLSRTLFDLASVLQLHQIERAVNQAEIQHLTDSLSLPDLVARYPGRPGVRAIRSILKRLEAGPVFTRSDLEAILRVFARRAGLPTPLFNAIVLGFECDCVWPEHGLIVELDGRATHGTKLAFEQDRERDRVLQAAGWRVVRITWRQLKRDPDAVAADLRTLLAAARPRRGPARAAGP